jgi:transketolase
MAIRASTSTVLMGHKFGEAHLVSSLSCIDILIASFSHFEKQEMKLILSKGHAACAFYTVIAEFGKILRKDLLEFNRDNSRYGIHVSSHLLNHVVLSTGSLGHGLSVGAGMAYGAKLSNSGQYSVVVLGDGETNEGSVWEASLIAASLKLDNLIAIVDMNAVQSVAEYHEVNGEGSLLKKFESFGWDVIEVDGHSLADLKQALQFSTRVKNKPTAILADTKSNARVPSMQSGVVWHYRKPNEDDVAIALKELNSKTECPEIVELFK